MTGRGGTRQGRVDLLKIKYSIRPVHWESPLPIIRQQLGNEIFRDRVALGDSLHGLGSQVGPQGKYGARSRHDQRAHVVQAVQRELDHSGDSTGIHRVVQSPTAQLPKGLGNVRCLLPVDGMGGAQLQGPAPGCGDSLLRATIRLQPAIRAAMMALMPHRAAAEHRDRRAKFRAQAG